MLENAPMKDYSTFRVGGPAKALVTVFTVSELGSLTGFLKSENLPYMILGNGSNILVSDQGYEGVAIRLGGDFEKVAIQGNSVQAGAGVLLTKLALTAQQEALSGIEFAYGIPGTLGGAMVMNAGAYGGEMKDVTVSVDVLDETGSVRTLTAAEMAFGYRDSVIKHRSLIVLSAMLKLKSGDRDAIMSVMQEHMNARRSKQPLEYPSAGSTFKRPEGYFAGKLIQDAGLSGKSIGGAQVSEKHCGFVINRDGATAKDIDELMNYVKAQVKRTSGVELEPEVIKIGEF